MSQTAQVCCKCLIPRSGGSEKMVWKGMEFEKNQKGELVAGQDVVLRNCVRGTSDCARGTFLRL